KDPSIKEKVQRVYKRAFDDVADPVYRNSSPPPGVTMEKYAAQHAAVEYLTDHFHEAPVWIVPCVEPARRGDADEPPDEVKVRLSCASIYPAIQNMLLA